jgi:DNA-binding NtrC family response regulator
MATILLIGTDGALLEGVAQLLAGSGHKTSTAHTLAEGRALAAVQRPLAVLVETGMALEDPQGIPAPMARGGAVLLYRTDERPSAIIPAALQRLVLADLALPLERHRLLTLVRCMADRAFVTGRREHPQERRPH